MTGYVDVSNEEVRGIWDRKAAFWDDYMKEGNRQSSSDGSATRWRPKSSPEHIVFDLST